MESDEKILHGQPPMDYGSSQISSTSDFTANNEQNSSLFYISSFRSLLGSRRYFVVAVAFLGLFNVYAMRVNFSVAILYLLHPQTVQYPNGTTVIVPPVFPNLENYSKGLTLGAFFYGYIFTQLPGGWLACRMGGKKVLAVGVAVSAILALVTPLAVTCGFWFLVIVRIVQGFAQGVSYPSLLALLSHWAPLQEKTVMATIIVAGAQFGTVVALPLSALLADSFGWQAIFYFFGTIGLLWSLWWYKCVEDTPYLDNKITHEELKYITSNVGYSAQQVQALKNNLYVNDSNVNDVDRQTSFLINKKARFRLFKLIVLHQASTTPWRHILTSGPVWAIVVTHFCENWGFYIMLTELPTFLAGVYDLPISTSGFLSALPYLVLGLTGPMAGFLADYLRTKKRVNTLIVRRTFNGIPLVLQALFILATAHFHSASVAVVCIVLMLSLGGFVWSAFAVNQLDIAPQYAGIIMGLSNTVATIPGIVGPSIVSAVVINNYISEWQIIFYIMAIVYMFGAVVYTLLSSADLQPWAGEDEGASVIPLEE